MARILIAVWPSDGHVNPTIPVANMLVERGHEVVWYCSSLFEAKIKRTGARFVPYTHLKNFSGSTLNEHFPEYMKLKGLKQFKWGVRNIIAGTMEGFYKDICKIRETFEPDVLVICPTFTGIVPIRMAGDQIPTVCLGMLPLSVTSPDVAPFGLGIPPVDTALGRLRNQLLTFLVQKMIFRREQEHFNRILDRMKLPRLDYWVFDAVVYFSDLYLQGTCPSFEYPNRALPEHVRFVGPFNLPTPVTDYELPMWWNELQSAKRVILVTQGTLANENFNQLMIPAIQALADQPDVLVIATTGHKALPTFDFPLPAHVKLEKFIPYSLLMPHLDAMITNAGYGGVHFAIQHGVPLITWGKSEDKNEVSARVEWSGIGINLKSKRVRAKEIAKAVHELFDNPSYLRNAQKMKQEIAAYDAYLTTVQSIEEMAAKVSASRAHRSHTALSQTAVTRESTANASV